MMSASESRTYFDRGQIDLEEYLARNRALKTLSIYEETQGMGAVRIPSRDDDLNRQFAQKLTSDQWAEKIKTRWQETVEGIFDVARDVETSHRQLGPKEWNVMITQKLRWSVDMGYKLKKIAEDSRLRELDHGLIPASWRTVHELTKLTDPEFKRAVEKDLIHADLERRDIAKLRLSDQSDKPKGTGPGRPRGSKSSTKAASRYVAPEKTTEGSKPEARPSVSSPPAGHTQNIHDKRTGEVVNFPQANSTSGAAQESLQADRFRPAVFDLYTKEEKACDEVRTVALRLAMSLDRNKRQEFFRELHSELDKLERALESQMGDDASMENVQ